MRRLGMHFPPLQCMLFVALFIIFSTTTTITIEVVSAWIVYPGGSSNFRGHRSLHTHRRTTSSLPLLYQKGGGGKENRRKPQKKDQQQQRQKSESFFNTTGLYYMNDDGIDDIVVVTTNDTIPTTSSSPSPSIKTTGSATGNFGDIMSPTCDDADILFQDGLVTSETYSLEEIYGISNPLDRMAVTANGNLQRLFSSYYDSPVVVEMVQCTRQQKQQNHNQKESASSIGDDDDDVDDDATTTAIWDRRVLLKIFGNQTFCTADSVVEVHSREVEDLVESGKVGIGQIFRHFNILPEFILLTAGPTDDGGFWRNYTLESDLVTCSIREVFCKNAWELSPGTITIGPQ